MNIRAMSSVPDDNESRSSAAPIPAKRTGAYRRSLSVEQKGKERDNQVFRKEKTAF